MPNGWKRNVRGFGHREAAGGASHKFCRCSGCRVGLARSRAGIGAPELAAGGKDASALYAGRYAGRSSWRERRQLERRQLGRKGKYRWRALGEVEPSAAEDEGGRQSPVDAQAVCEREVQGDPAPVQVDGTDGEWQLVGRAAAASGEDAPLHDQYGEDDGSDLSEWEAVSGAEADEWELVARPA